MSGLVGASPPLELPPQLKWKFAHEPELLGWTIRARNYNTFVANCMLAFMSAVTAAVVYATHPPSELANMPPLEAVATLCFYLFILLTISCMTHQRMNFAYRLTHSGLEYCKWKDLPKWALPFLKWLSGITAIIFIFMATIDPAFLIGALVGPGGMGLMYLQMAHSKSYRELHTQYHHHEFKWEEFTQLAIATNREVVDLKYSVIIEGDDYTTNWNLNIFCKRKQKDSVAHFLRPYLSPDVPFIKAKVNVPMSTD